MIPRAQQFRPGAALVRLDIVDAAQPFRLTQAIVERVAQITAVVDLRRRDIRMHLAGELTERLTRLARRSAEQQAFIDRVARAQRFRRRRDRALVIGGRHAGEGGVVAPDRQRDLVCLVAQRGAQEGVARQCAGKGAADALRRRQDVVLTSGKALHFALAQQVSAVFQRYRHLAAVNGDGAAAGDAVAAAVRRHFYRVARAFIKGDVAIHVQGADRVARRHGAAARHP